MPLRDHFHPPVGTRRHWQGFHSAWTNAMVRQLSQRLPPRYVAEPQIHLGAHVEADVANFEELLTPTAEGTGDGVATAVWAPPRPTHTVAVDFRSNDLFEVQVYDEERALRLVAVVE